MLQALSIKREIDLLNSLCTTAFLVCFVYLLFWTVSTAIKYGFKRSLLGILLFILYVIHFGVFYVFMTLQGVGMDRTEFAIFSIIPFLASTTINIFFIIFLRKKSRQYLTLASIQ